MRYQIPFLLLAYCLVAAGCGSSNSSNLGSTSAPVVAGSMTIDIPQGAVNMRAQAFGTRETYCRDNLTRTYIG